MNAGDLSTRLEFAKKIALEAGRTILKFYQDPDLKVQTKRDKTVVSEADTQVEFELRQKIREQFPADAIIGEEGVDETGTSDFVWILDPIDGTQSFVCGVPLFGSMIGVTYKDAPVIGVVHLPAIKEFHYASLGGGAWWQSESMAGPVRSQVNASVSRLDQCLFLTTSHSGFERIQRRRLFDDLLSQTKKFRGWGSCYGHMLVATGRADLMVDPDVKLWDCAAIYPIVTEAGGRFLDIQGRPRIDSGSAISCAAGIEIPLCELLNKF